MESLVGARPKALLEINKGDMNAGVYREKVKSFAREMLDSSESI